jgi:hypothetical protein
LVGWGRVYLDCLSSLYIVGEPAPTGFMLDYQSI